MKDKDGELIAKLAFIFARPFLFNGAISILNKVVGLNIPVFTYWQMFVLLCTFVIVCKALGNIIHGKDEVK